MKFRQFSYWNGWFGWPLDKLFASLKGCLLIIKGGLQHTESYFKISDQDKTYSYVEIQ